ncbi:MAG TPA: ELWxxDGT repeat protein [Thermoanaerobaculia bacterium]|nr:ELWxxDGT repeat protein [Thermoanaerobaculia bacterium]
MSLSRPAKRALLLVLFAATAHGQNASLVRDIRTTGEETGIFSVPESFAVLREDRVLFAAGDRNTGQELWVTDGTSSGTRLLEDVCPGYCSSAPVVVGVVDGVALLLLNTREEATLWQLWRSDGTEAGTYPLDVPFAPGHPSNGETIAFSGGVLYFGRCSAELGCELWRSDGTAAGTGMVKKVIPSTSYAYFGRMVSAGNRLYFSIGGNDAGLWTSNGTAAGTLSLVEYSSDDVPFQMTGIPDGRLFFTDANEQDGPELRVSDGTVAGTRTLTRFEATDPFLDTALKPIGNRVYFLADDGIHGREIWRSDGTEKGTVRVTDFGVNEPWEEPHRLRELLAEVGGRLVFMTTSDSIPQRLWVSDGRPESTAPLSCGGCQVGQLVTAGGKAFFFASEPAHGIELWVTDGTPAGTRITRDLCDMQDSECSRWASLVSEHQGGVLFQVVDSVHGVEIWFSDGTAAGTRQITDVPGGRPSLPSAWIGSRLFHGGYDLGEADLWVSENGVSRPVADLARNEPSSRPEDLVPLGDRLLFTACDGATRSTWISTGAPEGTSTLQGHPSVSCLHVDNGLGLGPVPAAGRLFYAYERQLWSTDGTPGGAVQLTNLDLFSVVYDRVSFQGKLFFHVQSGGRRAEVWKSDGTPQGTVKAFELLPEFSQIEALTAIGNELYFVGETADGTGVWRSDGTQAGTRKLTNGINPQDKPWFTRAGSSVFFVMQPSLHERELWKTDGTTTGTVRVSAIPGDLHGGSPADLTEHQGKLYFFAPADGSTGWNLWRSDGTAAGTHPVRAFERNFDFLGLPAFRLRSFAGRMVFAADGDEHGTELWTSDGTAEGTVMLLDLNPGAASSHPSELTVAGSRLYFAAHDGERGRELWSSDGTVAGTHLEHDLAPEDLSSDPGSLTATSTHLYFAADDGLSGRELWSLPLSGGGGCQSSSRSLCLGGRYRVEAAWKDFQGNRGAGQAVGLTADTGYFWFFSPTNVEVILKVLDGTGLNGHRWVFYGALSSVEYTLTVTDTQTGLTRRYFNPMSQLASVGDTTSFGPLGAFSRTPSVAEPAPTVLAEERATAAGPCQPTAERLCLNSQRFAVEVAWKDFQGNTGKGKAVNLTADTGYFWFFDAGNVELVLKVLDGTGLNGKHWVFYGALSSVEYTITVTDTQTGAQKIYKNPSGSLASVADTGAF